MNTVIVVAIVVFVFFLALAIYLAKLPPAHKHVESEYHYHPVHIDDMGNGKCRHNRTRRNSRRANINGAWRQK